MVNFQPKEKKSWLLYQSFGKKNIREVLADMPELKITAVRDRAHIELNGADYAEVSNRLTKVFGIQNSPSIKVEKSMPVIKEEVVALFKEIYREGQTFKIAARRADHNFELDSTELNIALGDVVFDNFSYAKVQMKKPDITLRVEIRQDATYLSFEDIKGAGGMPVGTAGRGHLMLSGGIDSPVAGYLALKRGVEIEAVHFASPPYTSPGALKKAKDLAAKLTVFGGSITFIEVPFTEIQEEIKAKAPQAYLMTITRRFMMRVVDRVREERGGKVIINGESLGQVASQTLGSMSAINEVTNTPVIRPVVTMDKNEIIEIAEKKSILLIYQFYHLKIVVLSLHHLLQKQIQNLKIVFNMKREWMLRGWLTVRSKELCSQQLLVKTGTKLKKKSLLISYNKKNATYNIMSSIFI